MGLDGKRLNGKGFKGKGKDGKGRERMGRVGKKKGLEGKEGLARD